MKIITSPVYTLHFSDGTKENNIFPYIPYDIYIEDSYIQINNKRYKLEIKWFLFWYTYQIKKTKINITSIEDFTRHIMDIRNAESPFCHSRLLETIQEKVTPIK